MSDTSFEPDWLSAPGATIADMLEQKNLSIEEFADLLGCSQEKAEKLLHGRTAITRGVAKLLEDTIGGSARFWLSRETQYRNEVARLQGKGDTVAAKEWLSELPLKDMIQFGWIKAGSDIEQKVSSCLKFFDVKNVAEWRNTYGGVLTAVAFRTSATFESEPGAALAWLRRGEIQASKINCKPWSASGFERSLIKARRLTRSKDPNTFVPKLRSICAEHGVALVIARAPAGCRASGATRFLSPQKAMILLSFRYLSDDQFWFTFFHEAGHLILHSDRALFLEDGSDVTLKEEHEANLFAQNLLIPPESRSEIMEIEPSKENIMRVAVKIGISRGIVVGQLQHLKRVEPSKLNWMKRRFNWNDLKSL